VPNLFKHLFGGAAKQVQYHSSHALVLFSRMQVYNMTSITTVRLSKVDKVLAFLNLIHMFLLYEGQ
jgi:hypothetical protein